MFCKSFPLTEILMFFKIFKYFNVGLELFIENIIIDSIGKFSKFLYIS